MTQMFSKPKSPPSPSILQGITPNLPAYPGTQMAPLPQMPAIQVPGAPTMPQMGGSAPQGQSTDSLMRLLQQFGGSYGS